MDSEKTVEREAIWALIVLFAINTLNFFDRLIIGAVGELIRKEFELSDTSLGLLGTAFILLYALVGVPLGRLADVVSRKWILAGGVFAWSALTAASGAAATYGQLIACRLGVGIGEASCAPAANSLIGDLFRSTGRARALSLFMLGLPLGNALSFLVGGEIASHPQWGWRVAFYMAGLPGVLCALAAMTVREPARGATEAAHIGSSKREGSPYLIVLAIPTMLWIIASGALHNFNMYSLGSFLAPLLSRYHGCSIEQAGRAAMLAYGLAGVPGLFLGGIAADYLGRRWTNGRLLLGATSLLLSAPLVYFGLRSEPGSVAAFVLLLGAGCMLMYVYYASVYATIQDVIEPSLRGTAMALYFFAMYLLGGALGPYVMGFLSDHFVRQAAAAAGVTTFNAQTLEPFKGQGLHTAMLYIVPVLNLVLAGVLFAAARTVGRDVARLRSWMESQLSAK